MNDIDKLTLELFTNKTQYKKYLSKIDPENYNNIEFAEFREKCINHKDKILQKTEYLLSNYSFHPDSLEDPYYRFVKELIMEIEIENQKIETETEMQEYWNEEDIEEEDMLFPEKRQEGEEEVKHSYFGKERVIQRDSNGEFVSHYPTNTSRRRFGWKTK